MPTTAITPDRRAMLDQVVQLVCHESGFGPHPNAKARAAALGLRLKPVVRQGAVLFRTQVWYDRRASREQQQRMVAQCVARHGLRTHGGPADAAAVRYVAAALLGQEAGRA